MSGQVAEYSGLVANIAERMARSQQAKIAGAEYDDLYQEGLIAVWQTLLRELRPAKDVIEYRMQNYIRNMRRQSKAEHFEILPIEGAEEFDSR